jgi:Putative papain-like cysteine peptidase (DUF1796)
MTMINSKFDHIISLGSFCQTAHQIRRHFGCENAHIFDWWVTPTVALVELMESGFSDLFSEQNMTIVTEAEGEAVMCARYGLMHYHDFDDAKISGTLSPFLVRAACQENMSKFSYLLKRLLKLSGDVLFIRAGSGYVKNYSKNMEFNIELATRFTNALERLIPAVNFKILLLDSSAVLEDRRFFTDSLNTYNCESWNGSDQGWSELFERQQISLRKTAMIVIAPDDAPVLGDVSSKATPKKLPRFLRFLS